MAPRSFKESSRSLRRRAALGQTIIISAVVLVFSAAIISYNAYRLNDEFESRIDGIARLAETSLASAVWQVDHASARDFINAVLQNDAVSFAQVVTGPEVMATRSRPELAGRHFAFFQDTPRFVTRSVEIRKFGEQIGTFKMAVSTAPIHKDLMVMAGTTLLLALVLILVITQITFYFSRRNLFMPLKRLEESATAIADGDLDAPIDISLPGELGTLARAFDDMRSSVRHLIDDLQEANNRLLSHRDELEETVKRRTEELNRKNVTLNKALEDIHNARRHAEVANVAKSRFLASMSHEIRTPMNAILGMADILWETELDEEQASYVKVFRDAGENLLEILNDILDISKIEAGKMELEETAFVPGDLIRDTCTVMQPKAQEKGLGLHCALADGVPENAVGDPARLRQVLTNLVGNAIKFTSEGEVRLHVEPGEPRPDSVELLFTVTDTGPGIPVDRLGTIFEPFTQADSSTTRKHGGTGLGLAISKQLVQMMNGRIWADSGPGQGSTFRFTARLRPGEGTNRAPADSHPVDGDQKLPPLKVLMVEDSGYNAFVIETYLKDTECTLTTATNGREGFEQYKNGSFDVVLMDIQMPEMDGYEATRAIRELEREQGRPRMPVVAMTAYALVGDAEKCFEAGADYHLPKPVKKSALFRLLAKALDSEPGDRVYDSTDADADRNSPLDGVEHSVRTTLAALERGDYATVRATGKELSMLRGSTVLETIAGYGDALREAADGGPEPVRQVLAVLSEYIERNRSL